MITRDATTALRRFGLGARPGEMARIAADPRGFVLSALADPRAALIEDASLNPSHVTFAAALDARQRLARKTLEHAADAGVAAPASAAGLAPAAASPQWTEARPKPGRIRRAAFLGEAAARIARGATAEAAFLERLVMFWSNHFCVSAAKGAVRGLAGAYEREAIRPHVLGRFSDMLIAAERHPAMLIYLDNQLSVGPGSRVGIERKRGLNENLAREILELHTLGVDGGYGQEDVLDFARILTGWTVGNRAGAEMAEAGKFVFAPSRHEPGVFGVLTKRYGDGERAGLEVLGDLARHPATARHIAGKFVRHFVADQAPDLLVEALARRFVETDGDLGALATALVRADAAWEAPARKVLPPYDFLLAVARGLAIPYAPEDLLRLSARLGQPLWAPPAPSGFPDGDIAWASPSALSERLRIAEAAARQVDATADPRQRASELLGEGLASPTRLAVARAEVREQGFELLLMSPEFQRR
jgi:uncharacterized protein (DUF1800 family)